MKIEKKKPNLLTLEQGDYIRDPKTRERFMVCEIDLSTSTLFCWGTRNGALRITSLEQFNRMIAG